MDDYFGLGPHFAENVNQMVLYHNESQVAVNEDEYARLSALAHRSACSALESICVETLIDNFERHGHLEYEVTRDKVKQILTNNEFFHYFITNIEPMLLARVGINNLAIYEIQKQMKQCSLDNLELYIEIDPFEAIQRIQSLRAEVCYIADKLQKNKRVQEE